MKGNDREQEREHKQEKENLPSTDQLPKWLLNKRSRNYTRASHIGVRGPKYLFHLQLPSQTHWQEATLEVEHSELEKALQYGMPVMQAAA